MMDLLLLIAIVSSIFLCFKSKMTTDTRCLVKRTAYISWLLYLLPIILHISYKLLIICILIIFIYLIARLLNHK